MSDALEKHFYTVWNVTPTEMWHAVGEHLQRVRLRRKLKPIDVERADGPSYKTVQAIENGEAGTTDGLDKYARALQLSIVDVLHDVLATRETPLSPEAAQIVRKFNETTIAGRQALLMVANALPPAPSASGTPPIPGGEATRPKPHR